MQLSDNPEQSFDICTGKHTGPKPTYTYPCTNSTLHDYFPRFRLGIRGKPNQTTHRSQVQLTAHLLQLSGHVPLSKHIIENGDQGHEVRWVRSEPGLDGMEQTHDLLSGCGIQEEDLFTRLTGNDAL